ncbi:MAG: hypothetical protein R6V61_10925 [Wenzhouxiangellaceae bacterium]
MKGIPTTATIALLLAWMPIICAADTHRLNVGGVNLTVEMDNAVRAGENGYPWTEWLTTTLQATRTVTGGFPRDDVRIKLQGTSRSSNAIAFGQVRRSRPPQLRFYVSSDASLEGLNADWRGYHEFAHLLIPFPGNDDIWFTEGFASYYQYLLQSRAGVISQRQAWEELLAGFERGESDRSGRGRTLRSLSPNMWHERAQKRVYWTGAAFFLRVDTRLRTETDDRHSLDKTLAAFHECCMDRHRRWNAKRLIDTLGELSVPEIWQQEYHRTIDARAEPRYREAIARLGISRNRSGLQLDGSAQAQALRDAIAGARGPMDSGRLATPEALRQESGSVAP